MSIVHAVFLLLDICCPLPSPQAVTVFQLRADLRERPAVTGPPFFVETLFLQEKSDKKRVWKHRYLFQKKCGFGSSLFEISGCALSNNTSYKLYPLRSLTNNIFLFFSRETYFSRAMELVLVRWRKFLLSRSKLETSAWPGRKWL